MQKANILGNAYSFVDGKLNIFGIDLYSGTTVKILTTQGKTNNKGMSELSVSRGREGKEFEVSVELSMKDIERIIDLIPSGNLTDMPPTEFIYIMNSRDSKRVVIAHVFEFTNDGVDTTGGDTEARMTYNGICSDVSNTKIQ